MPQKPTEEEIIKLAAQFRKPDGDKGIEIGNFMSNSNTAINLHSIAILNPTQKDNILEIGMGNGYFVKNIVSLSTDITYTGCDYSELMVTESKKKNYQFKKNATFIQANIQELPFEENSFNKILSVNTLYFWDDFTKVFNEIKRVLKPSGELIITVRPKHILEKNPVTQYGFSILSEEEILELLKENGFGEVQRTKIFEPAEEYWGEMFEKECQIFKCVLT